MKASGCLAPVCILYVECCLTGFSSLRRYTLKSTDQSSMPCTAMHQSPRENWLMLHSRAWRGSLILQTGTTTPRCDRNGCCSQRLSHEPSAFAGEGQQWCLQKGAEVSGDGEGGRTRWLHNHFSKLPPEIQEPLVMSVDRGWSLMSPFLKDWGVGLNMKMDGCCYGTL